MNAPNAEAASEISIQKMRAYISYCKAYVFVFFICGTGCSDQLMTHCNRKCAPRLSHDAAQLLSSHFVDVRSRVRGAKSSIPITIRYVFRILFFFAINSLNLIFLLVNSRLLFVFLNRWRKSLSPRSLRNVMSMKQ
jgi:hypothetical protein